MRERPPYLIWPLDGVKLLLTFAALVLVFISVLTQRTQSAQPRPISTVAVTPTRPAVVASMTVPTATRPPATATQLPTPTLAPTKTPQPTAAPTQPATRVPTAAPTVTLVPTQPPTQAPTLAPTATPVPTQAPTLAPTQAPTLAPTVAPTTVPTSQPTPGAGAFAVTLPESGATLRTPRPIFIGVGRSGDVVTVLDGQRTLGTTTIDARGRWRFVTPEDLPAGEHTINFQVRNAQGELQRDALPLKIVIAP
ncbi:MAG: hypothetical protein IT330_15375 [Anaerolineae bacterium]|nr:hypothetical protein [Anaerolineae bacterium]